MGEFFLQPVIFLAIFMIIAGFLILVASLLFIPLNKMERYELVLYENKKETIKTAIYLGSTEDTFDYLEELYLELKSNPKTKQNQYDKVKALYFLFLQKKALAKYSSSSEFGKNYFYIYNEFRLVEDEDVLDFKSLKKVYE